MVEKKKVAATKPQQKIWIIIQKAPYVSGEETIKGIFDNLKLANQSLKWSNEHIEFGEPEYYLLGPLKLNFVWWKESKKPVKNVG